MAGKIDRTPHSKRWQTPTLTEVRELSPEVEDLALELIAEALFQMLTSERIAKEAKKVSLPAG